MPQAVDYARFQEPTHYQSAARLAGVRATVTFDDDANELVLFGMKVFSLSADVIGDEDGGFVIDGGIEHIDWNGAKHRVKWWQSPNTVEQHLDNAMFQAIADRAMEALQDAWEGDQ